MKTRPILFSGPMVRAIMQGNKTQTRRVIKPQPSRTINDWSHDAEAGEIVMYRGQVYRLNESRGRNKRAPGELVPQLVGNRYGQVGDRFWVREAWAGKSGHVFYRADDDSHLMHWPDKWRPSIFMPRWVSRLTLEITGMRIERLQEITEEDAAAEGTATISMGDMPRQAVWNERQDFAQLWDSINLKRGHGWDTNPMVQVIEFKLVDQEDRDADDRV